MSSMYFREGIRVANSKGQGRNEWDYHEQNECMYALVYKRLEEYNILHSI